MPRKYAAKGKPYNDDSMNNAIREISEAKNRYENTRVRAVARKWGVKKGTLFNRLEGKHISVVGRKTVIPYEKEQELAECLKLMAKWGFGISKEEVLNIVCDYVA
jgi:hypothetical protein